MKKSWADKVFITNALLLLVVSFINQCFPVLNQEIITCFMSIAVFGSLIKCELPDGALRKYITFVSRSSYGMYLTHILIISVFVKVGLERIMPIAVVPVVMVFVILCIETFMMFIINKLKLSKYLGGWEEKILSNNCNISNRLVQCFG